jgi:hypothetical protein
MKNLKIILGIIICMFFAQKNAAQMTGTPYIPYEIPIIPNVCTDIITKGTDFWVSFGYNAHYSVDKVILKLKIATDNATAVTLNFTASGDSYTFNAGTNSLTTIDLANVGGGLGDKRYIVYPRNNSSGVHITDHSLHITSVQPISVYAFNTGSNTADATIVLPVDAWGRDYYKFSHEPALDYTSPVFDAELIIAREPTVLTLPEGTVNLSAGEVYSLVSVSDMTGRRIISDRPVAYFTHSTMASIPAGRNYYDILFEQMMSVDRWGKQFLVPNAIQKERDGSYVNAMNNLIRIIASENGTKVNFSGATRNGGQSISSGGTLNAGQWVELLITSDIGASYINSDKAIGVCAYLVGAGNSSWPYLGDPAIAWIPALNQTVKSVLVAPFYPGTTSSGGTTTMNNAKSRHFITVITKTATKTATKINNSTVSSGWTDNPASGYSYYTKEFNNSTESNSTFKIENQDNGIIVLAHGTANIESYYYDAGSGACVIN